MGSLKVSAATRRIPLLSITLIRREGRVHECNKAAVFLNPVNDERENVLDDPFIRAAGRLAVWGGTAPEYGGYHKVDFEIKWADGQTYEGRFDLTRFCSCNLREHVLRNLQFMSGDWIPPHITKEQHATYMRDIYHDRGRGDQIEVAKRYLEDRGGLE